MHRTARWNAHRSYVVLAFLLIIIALILAGCVSVRRQEEGTTTAAIIGRQMDQQANEIKRQVLGAAVERAGEGMLPERAVPQQHTR